MSLKNIVGAAFLLSLMNVAAVAGPEHSITWSVEQKGDKRYYVINKDGKLWDTHTFAFKDPNLLPENLDWLKNTGSIQSYFFKTDNSRIFAINCN